jgi:hypothetical protein
MEVNIKDGGSDDVKWIYREGETRIGILLFSKNKCVYKKGLGNAHPALCSTFL